jgi:hypothetical protein
MKFELFNTSRAVRLMLLLQVFIFVLVLIHD